MYKGGCSEKQNTTNKILNERKGENKGVLKIKYEWYLNSSWMTFFPFAHSYCEQLVYLWEYAFF